jgi:uncharacterized membrane protein YgcG
MSADRPADGMPRFGAGELPETGVAPDELDAELRLGRELEGIGGQVVVAPSAGFADRVMAAVAAEPVPAPIIAAGSALRAGAAGALLASVRDAVRVGFGAGFPAVARAQALVLVLVVALALGGTTYVAARALGILDQHASKPSPTLPGPTVSPAPPSFTPTPSPSPSPTPSSTPDATDAAEPSETPEATHERPTATEDHGGSGGGSGSGSGSHDGSGDGSGSGGSGGGSGSGSGSSGGATSTHEPSDDHGGDGTGGTGGTPEPTEDPSGSD